MIDSKFQCNQEVWLMKLGKPVKRFVYQVTQLNRDPRKIFYTMTTAIGFYSTENLSAHETLVFGTRKLLLSSLKPTI